MSFVHADDRALVRGGTAGTASRTSSCSGCANRFGEWRHLEAHVTDLRGDRQVRGVVLNARDVTERVRLEEELTRQAFHDGLTGLANRALFRDRLDQALARSARSRDVLAVLLVDLDGFKQVNDSLGHDAGDELLQDSRGALRAMSHGPATPSRGSAATSSRCCSRARTRTPRSRIAERLLEQLAEPMTRRGPRARRSAPASASSSTPAARRSSEELIRHADVAMYAAKEAGPRPLRGVPIRHGARARRAARARARAARWGCSAASSASTTSRRSSSTAARSSASRRCCAGTRRRAARCRRTRFIPVAEATGLILPLGEFVLREACAQTARWRSDGVVARAVRHLGQPVRQAALRRRHRRARAARCSTTRGCPRAASASR